MSEEQKFGNCIFGGFKKEDVLNYINELLVQHEEEMEEIEEQHKVIDESLNKELDEKRVMCVRYQKEIKMLNEELTLKKGEIEKLVEEKNAIVENEEKRIKELEEEIEKLRAGVQSSEEEERKLENDIKRAEYIARERVNQIIRTGKARAENEYNSRISSWKKEKEDLKKAAYEEALKILNNAAARVYKYNAETKEEIEKSVEIAKKEAQEIIKSAKLIADKILRESAKIAFRQNRSGEAGAEFKICEQYDVKSLNKETDEEVLEAMQKLKGLDFLKDGEEGILKGNMFKRHRRNPLDGFKRKDRGWKFWRDFYV